MRTSNYRAKLTSVKNKNKNKKRKKKNGSNNKGERERELRSNMIYSILLFL